MSPARSNTEIHPAIPLAAMIIAINTRFLGNDTVGGYDSFSSKVLCSITEQHPQHRFYFLSDRPYTEKITFPSTVISIIINPPARHPLLWKYWFDVKLPLLLKKIKADVFVSPDGFCSLTTTVPQCVVVRDLQFLYSPETYKRSHLFFYKRYTPAFLKKAAGIITLSQCSRNDIIHRYGIRGDKINVVYGAAGTVFQPLSFEQKELVKERHTEGKEYFIYPGSIQPPKNLLPLLKAFSIFKKRQRSGMKLVLAERSNLKKDAFQELIKEYKYRQDVVLVSDITDTEAANLVGSAYASVYPFLSKGFGIPILEAMNCAVPVLTVTHPAIQEVGEEAALYFDPGNPSDMAERLMLIYKDEDLRNRLIQKGTAIAQKYSLQQTVDLLWQSIEKAAER